MVRDNFTRLFLGSTESVLLVTMFVSDAFFCKLIASAESQLLFVLPEYYVKRLVTQAWRHSWLGLDRNKKYKYDTLG